MVAEGDGARSYAQRLGIQKDQIVQELGWDEDCDDDIRVDIEDVSGSELLEDDADEHDGGWQSTHDEKENESLIYP